jgi:hypothetical protein
VNEFVCILFTVVPLALKNDSAEIDKLASPAKSVVGTDTKTFYVYKNGDKNSKGIKVVINSSKYKSFDLVIVLFIVKNPTIYTHR